MSGTTSKSSIFVYSMLSSCFISILSQGLTYKQYPGPLRFVGTFIASVVTFYFVWRWQEQRREKLETQRRFEVIAEMNDRIRNALQVIHCLSYEKDASATQAMRQAVEVIDKALAVRVLKS